MTIAIGIVVYFLALYIYWLFNSGGTLKERTKDANFGLLIVGGPTLVGLILLGLLELMEGTMK